MTINCVSLCSGYEGIGLGLQRVIPELKTIMYCEIEAYACCNLIDKMEAGLLEPAPIWTDLKSFCDDPSIKEMVEPAGGIDILTGGFP